LKLKGLIFDIQRFSVHDGPGIRTLVFFKGCPLRCLWCCNPEGQNPWPEIAYFEKECIKCYRCVAACPNNAIIIEPDGSLRTLKERCTNCGSCTKVCPTNARRLIGKWVTVDEVLKVVSKDMVFYRRGGGGLTLGGGEPLMQPEFARELLQRAKYEYGLHTAIETSMYSSPEVMLEVLKYVDFIFADIKHIDPESHKKLTGVDNRVILNNIRLCVERFVSEGKEFVIRVPIIPTLNDQKENLLSIANFLKSLKADVKVELLAYHELGKFKYKALSREYPLERTGIKPPSKEYMQILKETLEKEGLQVYYS